MSTTPDLLVVIGPRGLLSLVGIITIIAGVWYTDRIWDEKGSQAYERAKSSKPAADSTKKDASTGLLSTEVVIPEADLDEAFPFPIAFIVGWIIFALSFFFPKDGSFQMSVSSNVIAAALVCLVIGWVASVPMGDAVRHRNGPLKTKLSLIFVASWLLLTVVADGEMLLFVLFRALGAISIIASMKILWKFRKMGDSWEQQGMPNPNPVVYNIGGPLFVFGWFLFWIGMAATSDIAEGAAGIPIYFTWRSALAFLTGCGMVPVVMFVDYAHDEGAEFTGTFGTDGTFFGRFLESPIPFLLSWTLFGFASLLPLASIADVTARQWIILANCILQGIDAGILIQTALYKGDMAGKTMYSIPFVLLFLALAIEMAWSGGVSWLALPGAFLIVLGQKTVFGDRKRGDYWMETKEVNPNPIVYSAGEPLFMAGWILMSIVMAIPF